MQKRSTGTLESLTLPFTSRSSKVIQGTLLHPAHRQSTRKQGRCLLLKMQASTEYRVWFQNIRTVLKNRKIERKFHRKQPSSPDTQERCCQAHPREPCTRSSQASLWTEVTPLQPDLPKRQPTAGPFHRQSLPLPRPTLPNLVTEQAGSYKRPSPGPPLIWSNWSP